MLGNFRRILFSGTSKTYIIAQSRSFLGIAFVEKKSSKSVAMDSAHFENIIIHVNMRAIEGEEQ